MAIPPADETIKGIDMICTLTSSQLYKAFEITPAEQNILLVGKHGIGKSQIISDYFSAKGFPVITLFLGQMSDPGDLIGLPRINEKTGKTEFMPPYWFPVDGKPVVLFLDELNRARPEMLQSVMDLVLNRKLAGRELPAGSRILSAVNGGDEYQIGELDPALVSRFNVYEFRPSVDDWLRWAKSDGLDERVVRYITANPNMLDGQAEAEADSLDRFPDRRAWHRVANMMKAIDGPDPDCMKIVSGIIGMKAAQRIFGTLSATTKLTGQQILLKFSKSTNELKKLDLPALAELNENVFRTIELHDFGKYDADDVACNLEKYVNWLDANGKREPLAHLINIFISNSYPQANEFIITVKPTLYRLFTSFIKTLK